MVRRQDGGVYADAESVKRYDPESAAYIDVENGKVQKEGIWENVWPVKPEKFYLYNRGDECIDVTSGWTERVYGNNASSGGIYAIITSKEADHFNLRSNSRFSTWSDAGFNTKNKINLSKYSTLNAKITIDQKAGDCDAASNLCVVPEITSDLAGVTLAGAKEYKDVTEHILSVNISQITESAYIVCYMHSGARAGASHYIYEIWLE